MRWPLWKNCKPGMLNHWFRFSTLLVFLFLCFLLPATNLEWSRAEIANGEYWRLITGHWVHIDINHLILNLGGLFLTGLLFTRQPPLSQWIAYLALSPLFISVGLLLLLPDLLWYRGFSGTLHGLLVFTAIVNIRSEKVWALTVLLFIVGKVTLEALGGSVTERGLLISAPVIVEAHSLGAISGLMMGLFHWRHESF